MQSVKKRISIVFCFALVLLLAATVSAQNLNSLKAQMLNRKPTVDALKNRGIIGEGNDGYLHLRQKAADAGKVVNAENNDRKMVYTAIAKKNGSTVATVGKRRALQIAKISGAGQWLQRGDGTWYKK